MKRLIIWAFCIFVGIQVGSLGFDCLQSSINADMDRLNEQAVSRVDRQLEEMQ